MVSLSNWAQSWLNTFIFIDKNDSLWDVLRRAQPFITMDAYAVAVAVSEAWEQINWDLPTLGRLPGRVTFPELTDNTNLLLNCAADLQSQNMFNA